MSILRVLQGVDALMLVAFGYYALFQAEQSVKDIATNIPEDAIPYASFFIQAKGYDACFLSLSLSLSLSLFLSLLVDLWQT